MLTADLVKLRCTPAAGVLFEVQDPPDLSFVALFALINSLPLYPNEVRQRTSIICFSEASLTPRARDLAQGTILVFC